MPTAQLTTKKVPHLDVTVIKGDSFEGFYLTLLDSNMEVLADLENLVVSAEIRSPTGALVTSFSSLVELDPISGQPTGSIRFWLTSAQTDLLTATADTLAAADDCSSLYTESKGAPFYRCDIKVRQEATIGSLVSVNGGRVTVDREPRLATTDIVAFRRSPDTLRQLSGVYSSGGEEFYGAAPIKDGRIFITPFFSTTARIWDPSTETLSIPPGTLPGNGAYNGAIALLDGRIFIPPYTSTTALVWDPDTNAFTTPGGTYPAGSLSGGPALIGPLMLPDGRIYLPNFNSTTPRIWDPGTNTVSTPPGLTVNGFLGGCELLDGRLFIAPHTATSARVFDPVSNTHSIPSGAYPGNAAFYGACRLLDGRVLLIPYFSTTARIWDPVTNVLSTPPGIFPGGDAVRGGAFLSGTTLEDGRVLLAPAAAGRACIYDVAAGTVTEIPQELSGAFTAVSFADRKVMLIPSRARRAFLFDAPTIGGIDGIQYSGINAITSSPPYQFSVPGLAAVNLYPAFKVIANASTDRLTAIGRTVLNGTEFILEGTVVDGLAAGVSYYAQQSTGSTWRLATTPAGSPFSINADSVAPHITCRTVQPIRGTAKRLRRDTIAAVTITSLNNSPAT